MAERGPLPYGRGSEKASQTPSEASTTADAASKSQCGDAGPIDGMWCGDDGGAAEDIILLEPPAEGGRDDDGVDTTPLHAGWPEEHRGAVTPEDDAGESADDVVDDSELDAGTAAAEAAPSVTGKPMPPLPPRGSIRSLGVRRPGVAPKRIGGGRLVPSRLTWKPGDPFATAQHGKPGQFRWEVMLTSACITAACGLGCIWLLRTLLA